MVLAFRAGAKNPEQKQGEGSGDETEKSDHQGSEQLFRGHLATSDDAVSGPGPAVRARVKHMQDWHVRRTRGRRGGPLSIKWKCFVLVLKLPGPPAALDLTEAAPACPSLPALPCLSFMLMLVGFFLPSGSV